MRTPPTLARLLARQDRVLRRDQALDAGLTRHAIAHRLRPDGPWQVLVGSVYAAFTGTPTQRQRELAALLYAGPSAALGGHTALLDARLRYLPAEARITVVVPATVRRRSNEFVRVYRSTVPIRHRRRRDGLRTTSRVEALCLFGRDVRSLQTVRAVLTEAIGRQLVAEHELRQHVERLGTSGTRLLRRALGDVSAGARSAPEAEMLDGLRALAIPMPECNVTIYDEARRVLAVPDFLWRDVRLIVEVDSREFHLLAPGSAEATMRRHAALTAAGYTVLHVSPTRWRTDPIDVLREIEQTYRRLAA